MLNTIYFEEKHVYEERLCMCFYTYKYTQP